MTSITLDSTAVAKLAGLPGPVQLCDESGHVLGWYRPGVLSDPPPALQELAPLSEEELDRRSETREEGRPLKDIIRDLDQS